jgi:hypothetical protein
MLKVHWNIYIQFKKIDAVRMLVTAQSKTSEIIPWLTF